VLLLGATTGATRKTRWLDLRRDSPIRALMKAFSSGHSVAHATATPASSASPSPRRTGGGTADITSRRSLHDPVCGIVPPSTIFATPQTATRRRTRFCASRRHRRQLSVGMASEGSTLLRRSNDALSNH
jgi:hypothetical protein